VLTDWPWSGSKAAMYTSAATLWWMLASETTAPTGQDSDTSARTAASEGSGCSNHGK
jgi:hypothetical protein